MVREIDVVVDDAVVFDEAEDMTVDIADVDKAEMTVVVEGNAFGVVVDDDVDGGSAVVDDVNLTVVGTIMIKRTQIMVRIIPPIFSLK